MGLTTKFLILPGLDAMQSLLLPVEMTSETRSLLF